MTCPTMKSSGATLAVLALTVAINVAVTMNPPSAPNGKENETGIEALLQLLTPDRSTDNEQLMKTPVAFAFNAPNTNVNSSPKFRSEESVDEGLEISSHTEDFDKVKFSPKDTEELELMLASEHRSRSLTKLKELHCQAEEYPLVTIMDGTYVQLMSPGYPSLYPNSIRCGWKILTDPDHVIRVLCPVFQLSQGDFTLVKDYVNTTNIRFEASSPMKNVTTASNKLFLGFKSVSEGEGRWRGFVCVARSLPRPQPVGSAMPVGNVTGPMEFEVPDFKKRLGKPLTEEASKTTTEVVAYQPTISSVSELKVTSATALSSDSLLSSLSRGTSSPSVITGEYLLGLKHKAEEEGIKPNSVWINKPYAQVDQIKTYTVRRGYSTYVTDSKE